MPTDDQKEEQFIKQLQTNIDDDLFNKLVEPHLQYGYRVIIRILLNKHDSEDVLQEALIKVLKNIKRFRGEAKFRTWFSQICYYEALNFLRKKKKQAFNWDNDDMARVLDEKKSVEENFDSAVDKKILEDLINSLPPKQRLIIFKFYKDELSIKEISEELGESISCIKVNLFRARKKLKDLIGCLKS